MYAWPPIHRAIVHARRRLCNYGCECVSVAVERVFESLSSRSTVTVRGGGGGGGELLERGVQFPVHGLVRKFRVLRDGLEIDGSIVFRSESTNIDNSDNGNERAAETAYSTHRPHRFGTHTRRLNSSLVLISPFVEMASVVDPGTPLGPVYFTYKPHCSATYPTT